MGAPRSRPMGRRTGNPCGIALNASRMRRAPWDVWASRRVFHATSSCDGSSSSGPGRSSSSAAECISHVSGGSPVGSSTSSVASTSVGLHVLVDSVLPLDHRDVCSSWLRGSSADWAFSPRVFRSALADSFHAATGVAEVNRAVEDLDEAAESWLAWRSKRWVKSSIHAGERWKPILCCRIARRSLSRSPLGWFLLVGRLLG
eukprot:g48079.t1